MRQVLLGIGLVAAACAAHDFTPEPARVIRVLFIGNSLTAANDLPRTVATLAAKVHDSIAVEAVVRPNLAIIDHVNGASDAVAVIEQGRWDFVVLQQGPTSQQLGRDTLILAARMLEPKVRAAGGRIAQLMAWPAAENLSSFEGVLQTCQATAAAVDGVCLPAGQAWRQAWAVDPTLPFYGPDGYHPSELGSYLAALVVYEGITGNSAESLPDAAMVGDRTLKTSIATVQLLQRIAHEAVVSYEH